jgi:thiamine pyrophosphate-dependent acetolactate synthase large subunit-like protein
MSKKVAEVIVDTLVAAGVKHCYGIVGDTLNHIATAISRSDIKFVHMRHEEAGAFAAQGEHWSRITSPRSPAVAGRAACTSSTACMKPTATARRCS